MLNNKNAYKMIHKVLIDEWDPIGIKNFPEAQDEYDQYIPKIYEMLAANHSQVNLDSYLQWLEINYMGLEKVSDNKNVIKKLLKIKDKKSFQE